MIDLARGPAGDEPRLGELRLVAWELAPLAQGPPTTRQEVVPAADASRLVAALRRLHDELATSPHSGRPTARLRRVRVGVPSLEPGFWWTSPTLEDDDARARLVAWRMETVFEAPGAAASDPPDP